MKNNESPVIRLDKVTLGYGRDIILKDVNLEIPRGVFLPFAGPNGAAKTTLLRGILGLLRPFKGVIHTPFKNIPAGYVPQHKNLDPLFPLTVKEIIEMGFYPQLGWWKFSSAEERRKTDEVLEELDLSAHAHKNFRDLSGGTKQKTLLARALVSGADIFIMDEPTSELDERSEKEVLEHLARFVQKSAKTVLLAHHGRHPLIAQSASQVCFVDRGQALLLTADEWKKRGAL